MPKWEPGQSGNPAGRPRKGRVLADLLQQALAEKYFYQGHLRDRSMIMALLLAEGVTMGRLSFPTDEREQARIADLSVDQWLKLVTLVLGHLDGPLVPDGADKTADLDSVLDWVMEHSGGTHLLAPAADPDLPAE